ncbi:autotransporter domain protein [Campylobacter lanienae NCTC 13004]|uniref:Autotransporter domain protein n=1 Tax=Campylobacter lanienae NCTC 13004 TaxID=1031753 RepID=A0A1X9SPI2_9BACT|nr:autotransporter domain-containing protein [Campylobacter lanienae]ARQ98149.1 autotransporter domain protein [Campylobacter lanienae NCTC 13004]
MNNSKILLSSITISILCSVNLSAACSPGTENGNTCTVSGQTINGSFNPYFSRDDNIIGKNVIIDGGTTVTYQYGKSITGGNVRNKKADNNTLTITGRSNVHQFDIAAAKVNNPTGDGTSSASGNNLIISGEGTIVKKSNVLAAGWVPGKGTANDNNVIINSGATVEGSVFSGDAEQGESSRNNIIIDSATVIGKVTAGNVDSGGIAASENSVTISGNAVVKGDITGGGSNAREANSNEVTINDTAQIIGNITGGSSIAQDGTANFNKITIGQNANISQVTQITGATSTQGTANNNELNIAGSVSANTSITGGVGSTDASNNNILISGDSAGAVIGGQSAQGSANNNDITIGGNATGNITGGDGKDGASDNNILISGNSTGAIIGGQSDAGAANKNDIIIGGSVGGDVIGGIGNTDAGDNNITIAGSVTGNVTGGQSAQGTANKNDITIGGSVSGNVTGGEGQTGAENNNISVAGSVGGNVTGGKSDTTVASGNDIVIGGSVGGNVIGGDGKTGAENNNISVAGSVGGDVIGGKTDSGSAGNNIINIDGNTQGNIIGGQTKDPNGQTSGNQITANGNVDGNIYGGYNEATQKVQGSNNTITLSGDLTKVTGNIQVGDTTSNGGSGNTLNINTKNPVTLGGKTNGAQNINIAVGNLGAGDAAVTIGPNGSIDVGGTTISAELKVKDNFNHGDTLKLFQTQGNAKIEGEANSVDVTAVKGGAVTYKVEIDKSDLTKPAEAKITGITPETKTISEGLVAGAATISIASENTAGKGIESAAASTYVNMATAGAGTAVVAPFGSSMGGSSKIKTGSYVRSTGISLIVGAAAGKYTDDGKLTIGPFIEMGKNWYSTYNDFGNGEIRGDGDSRYIGAGLLARYDFGSILSSRPYVEASFRYGRNYNRYENIYMNDGFGNHAKYHMNTNYIGYHLGAGYEFRKDDKAIELYAKYLYTRLAGDEIEIMHIPYVFEAVESHRLLTGSRYKLDLDPKDNFKITPYAGVALDYEFEGSGDVYAAGFAVDSPTLRGASTMLEAGVTIDNNKGFSVDLGAFGHMGKRQGINGIANVKFEF